MGNEVKLFRAPRTKAREGPTIEGGVKRLQDYIASPINQQPRDSKRQVLSIKQAYIHRFGNNTPDATLPTQ